MRFLRWLAVCNNPRIKKMDAMSVHKRYRVCRCHFDSDCFNGGCRRLLNTAVPTLYLASGNHYKKEDESNDLNSDLTVYMPIKLDTDDTSKHFELVVSENKIMSSPTEVKSM